MKRLPPIGPLLIHAALEDLELVEKDPRYKVSMNKWHVPSWPRDPAGECYVCLAGAVIAKRLGEKTSELVEPSDYSTRICVALHWIDNVRKGEIAIGNHIAHVSMPEYQFNRKGFKKRLRWLANNWPTTKSQSDVLELKARFRAAFPTQELTS